MIVENFDNLIYGEDGQSPIRNLLIRMLETAKNDGVRLRVDVRSIAQGTVNSRNEHTLFTDPNESDADGLMRILVERLNDSPGEGFLGQIRINFAQAGSSGERYGSWTRTIRAPSTSAGRIGSSHASDEDEDGEYEDDNSAESFSRGESRPMMGGGGFSHGGGNGVMLSDEQVRLWMETMMGYVFRSQAQQFAMFERATRMMESYTLRFGFPTHEPGIVEARGGEIPASAAPGSPGPSGFGILPMLLQAATKIAAGGGDDPAPAPQPSTQLVPSGSAGRANGRAMAISGASRMVRALRNQPPVPKRPVEGYEDAPDVEEDEQPSRGADQWDDENTGSAHAESYEGEDEDDGDEGGDDGGGMPDMTGMSSEEMKAAVIAWIRADPSRKADVMNMLPDLSREIT